MGGHHWHCVLLTPGTQKLKNKIVQHENSIIMYGRSSLSLCAANTRTQKLKNKIVQHENSIIMYGRSSLSLCAANTRNTETEK